jgi:Cu-Zn family superoxide dismutase
MKLKQTWLVAATLVLMAGRAWCAVGMASVTGTTENSDVSGNLKFEDTTDGLKISGTIENVSPGDHAFHIHEFGDCGEEGKNAGSHYNPEGHPHGNTIKEGVGKVHVGDMGNLTFNEQGIANVNVLLKGVSLTGGKTNVAGRAVVLHEKKDDFSQPTGNAGGRIGCGPIVLTAK